MAADKKLNRSVLVLDNFAQTLAVVRSLGAAGYRVILGRGTHKPIEAYSRYCNEQWKHSNLNEALDNPKSFRSELIRLLEERPDISWIFPVTEIGIKVMLSLRESIPPHIQIAMVPETPFRICLDKQLANENCGLAYPESRVVENSTELSKAADDIGFPLIIKSANTTLRVFDRKAYIVRDLSIFTSVFHRWPQEHDKLIVQKFIAGRLEQSDFVAAKGELIAYCEGINLRTDMLDGTGLGVEFRSTAPSKAVFSATQKFIKTLNYSGPGLIQLIREEDTGTLYFIENNPRVAAGVAESVASGHDIPHLVLRALDDHATHRLKLVTIDSYQGQSCFHTHWLSRDIEGYLAQRPTLSKAQRREWLSNMLRSFRRAEAHVMWQWRDPLPGTYLYLKLAVGIIRQKFSR